MPSDWHTHLCSAHMWMAMLVRQLSKAWSRSDCPPQGKLYQLVAICQTVNHENVYNNIWPEQILHKNMYVFTYMKATIINNRRTINLEGNQACYIGYLEKRKCGGGACRLPLYNCHSPGKGFTWS